MGQYYYPIIKRGNSTKAYYSHYYDNGLKLMEHSYVGNKFTETVLKQLLENKGRLAWVGDYAKKGDVQSEFEEKFIKARENFDKYREDAKAIERTENSLRLKFINHTKKEYLDMTRYITKNNVLDKWGFIVHPIPLLTAIGNGKGGGDYWGTQKEKVGYWACDLIEAREWLEPEEEKYKDITSEIRFIEKEDN